jgi:hypothetical protein
MLNLDGTGFLTPISIPFQNCTSDYFDFDNKKQVFAALTSA